MIQRYRSGAETLHTPFRLYYLTLKDEITEPQTGNMIYIQPNTGKGAEQIIQDPHHKSSVALARFSPITSYYIIMLFIFIINI